LAWNGWWCSRIDEQKDYCLRFGCSWWNLSLSGDSEHWFSRKHTDPNYTTHECIERIRWRSCKDMEQMPHRSDHISLDPFVRFIWIVIVIHSFLISGDRFRFFFFGKGKIYGFEDPATDGHTINNVTSVESPNGIYMIYQTGLEVDKHRISFYMMDIPHSVNPHLKYQWWLSYCVFSFHSSFDSGRGTSDSPWVQ
jgi:hypothetical protein